MPHYHLCSTGLAIGSVVEPGNWGRIIEAIGPGHGRWLAESVMEHIRACEFRALPSRMRSAFFFDREDEARAYQRRHAHFLVLYEVELVNPTAPMHRADYRSNVPNAEFGLDWCRRYWSGEHYPAEADGAVCTEIFGETALRISGRMI